MVCSEKLFNQVRSNAPEPERSKHSGLPASGIVKKLHATLLTHGLFLVQIVNSWDARIESPQNVCIVSIPTIFDPNLAPPGKHVVHAYTAGNEPYR
jgi:phytoene dehydrogenase-like protein